MKSNNHLEGSFIPDMYSPRGEERYFSPLHKQIVRNLLSETNDDTRQNT